ncbi:MAG: hypothetical protein WCA10_03830 [Terracidiphilus sp.]
MPLNFGNPDFFSEMVLRRSIAGHRSQVHVLLHPTNGQDAVDEGAVANLEPFSIGDILWLCRLPDELRDAVFRACEARGDPPEEAYGNPGQLYCVALFMGPILEGTIASWDGYGYITKFVNYSQLLHPTSIGFGNTAILYFDDKGKLLQAAPGPCRGFAEHAFVVPDTRNWLSQAECETAKELFHNAKLEDLPDRVSRAHWSVQHAAYQYFFEVRTMLVASALDALIHVRNERQGIGTSQQFIDRVRLLAGDLGLSFSDDDAKGLWDHRSDVVHGRDPWLSVRDPNDPRWQIPPIRKSDPMVRRYLAAEEILRKAILRCLTDSVFASHFDSDSTVKAKYPLIPRPRPSRLRRRP